MHIWLKTGYFYLLSTQEVKTERGAVVLAESAAAKGGFVVASAQSPIFWCPQKQQWLAIHHL